MSRPGDQEVIGVYAQGTAQGEPLLSSARAVARQRVASAEAGLACEVSDI